MRHNLFFLLMITSVFSFGKQKNMRIANAGMEDSVPIKRTDSLKKKLFRPNSIKVNTYGLLINNYAFSYERIIKRNISVQLGFRYQPYNYLIDNIAGRKLAERGTIDPKYFNFKVGNYAVTADFRLYTSKKKEGKGIFFGLYGRYAHFDIDNVDYTFVNDKEIVYNVPLVSNVSGFGGGISSGIKWIIKKRVVIELYSGVHYLKLTGPLTSNKDLSGLSGQEKSDLKDNVEDIFTLGDKKYLTATVGDNGITGSISGPPIGIRSCLSIGFVFYGDANNYNTLPL